jgi:hypothetical protein
MTVRRRHAFLDFIAILALACWSEGASAQISSLMNPLGVTESHGGCIERPLASCAKPGEPERSPHRPRRDEVRSRAPHLRRPVRDREAAAQDGPRPARD